MAGHQQAENARNRGLTDKDSRAHRYPLGVQRSAHPLIDPEGGDAGFWSCQSIHGFYTEFGVCLPPGPPRPSPGEQETPLTVEQLIEELVSATLDIAGVFDPSPVSDGLGAANEIRRGNYGGAALNVISMVPYLGDLAKAGKLGRYAQTIERAISLARSSIRFAERIRPLIRRLDELLQLIPSGVNHHIDRMKHLVSEFLGLPPIRRVLNHLLPDISHTFRFGTSTATRNGRHVSIQWVEGRLGVPGTVMVHSNPASHQAISSLRHGSHPGDQAGHLAGAQFGAPDIPANLSPQNYITNSRANRADNWIPDDHSRQGTYRSLEEYWANHLRNGTGIEVRIEDVTRVGESRPFMRRASWSEIAPDGTVSRRTQEFMNPTNPVQRGLQD